MPTRRPATQKATTTISATRKAPGAKAAAAVVAPAGAPPAASPWASTASRAEQHEAKRAAVLQAAAQLFNDRGFHATSLDDVAARLKVSKPTLYYYVKSKDEILLQSVRQGLQATLDGIEASRRAGGRAIDQLVACMRVYGRTVTMDFGMCLIRVADEGLTPENRKELRRLKAAIDLEFRQLVAAGVAEGSLAPCDPKMTAFAIAGALSWIGRWYRPDGHYSREEVVEQCITTLLAGALRRDRAAGSAARASRAKPGRPASAARARTAR